MKIDIINGIREAIFPGSIYCICCGAMIDDTRNYALCDICAEHLHWINERSCLKCGKALQDTYKGELCYDCMRRDHSFSKGYSCLTYGLHEREMLMAYKYNSKGYYGKKFGDILYDKVMAENINTDLIVPVPLHKKREKKRGYNQTEIMAKQLSNRWGVPMNSFVLKRTRETTFLRNLSPEQRAMMIKGSFEVLDSLKEDILAKKILLIDDIYTTGATLDECAKTLLFSGVKQVNILTLASGGNRRPKEN